MAATMTQAVYCNQPRHSRPRDRNPCLNSVTSLAMYPTNEPCTTTKTSRFISAFIRIQTDTLKYYTVRWNPSGRQGSSVGSPVLQGLDKGDHSPSLRRSLTREGALSTTDSVKVSEPCSRRRWLRAASRHFRATLLALVLLCAAMFIRELFRRRPVIFSSSVLQPCRMLSEFY